MTRFSRNPKWPFTPTAALRRSPLAKGLGHKRADPRHFPASFRSGRASDFNPHSLRSMLVRHYMEVDLSPAQVKAVSQSLGHSDALLVQIFSLENMCYEINALN
jgi:hypothetical protein